jgi:hypothetical protein
MDDAMQKEYFDNFEKYRDKFEVGGKYNMLIHEDSYKNISSISFELGYKN